MSANKLSNAEIQALALSAADGDKQAFTQLHDSLYVVVWRLCCCRLDFNKADADDVTQNAFLKAYKNIKQYHGKTGEEFMGWLCRLTRNCCTDWVRSRSRWHEKIQLMVERWVQSHSPFEWAQEMMRTDKRWECIQRELLRFDRAKREVFIHRMQGYKIHEIADMMERPAGTIKAWLQNKRTGLVPVLREKCAQQ